jgi:hypothetical protein
LAFAGFYHTDGPWTKNNATRDAHAILTLDVSAISQLSLGA